MINKLRQIIQKKQSARNFIYQILKIAGFFLGPYYQGQFQKYCKAQKIRKLQIGCGANLLDGWLNADLKIGRGVFFLDAGRPFPFEAETLDYIFSEHLIEHLSYESGARLLRECWRVLKPGGRIRIATPDIRFLVELCRTDKTDIQKRYIQWAARRFLPDIPEAEDVFIVNNFFRSWGHSFIYDSQVLSRLLQECGFRDVHRYEVGESKDANFENLECHGRHIGEEFNRLETMVVEAVKPGS